MASKCARNLFQRSSSSAKALMRSGQSSYSIAVRPSKLNGIATPVFRLSPRHRLFVSSRLPVELGCGESLMPLHSVTASALLRSMLASKVRRWGYLSEDAAQLAEMLQKENSPHGNRIGYLARAQTDQNVPIKAGSGQCDIL
ncbi:protein NUCLEAR FUSION DEFECTIVE 6, mitochondrial-like [Andrographis paniculata]|uniref:protein NUCLEAR FUSION DEFECTIVE 6, mitochondrial-like n=1 Tax=Andrographis paniculata TaxID=175694 RepID=UPI0021E77527|nr:protein NUCLEAR FUSION DEFECTIVE 6, mitochondrial-like [Andrographis paniculata]XP_051120217.1 protein NUCLEAR FUSION DEFECTIVE 6, mitochondrial-like [Andrographis paniculata]XP_051120224.1 protein NUCLEAR FUSION DEFECTIVE 6, mitochondrial-like [Andrographis paniculata]XP_051120231.1 protein NUCLEAR FUSION DEFECTIVE 6, mitochondrial-like [Andrographis paniculata]XP_051120235.1 protein NUCLEAR FUSION DEFECTIVE 6, mitochondrial-like [Andrographis paniculata]XP_051120243.1 protein NUCLEAR FUSI